MTLRDEIAHYASCGMSMKATADVLGLDYETVKAFIRAEGLRHLFVPSRYARDCKGGGHGWPRGKRRPFQVRRSALFILDELRRYPDRGLFRSLADVDVATVHRRFGSFLAAHTFAQTHSPADPLWHYVAECADGICVS